MSVSAQASLETIRDAPRTPAYVADIAVAALVAVSIAERHLETIHEDHREAISANAKALGFCYAGCAGSWPCLARLESQAALGALREPTTKETP